MGQSVCRTPRKQERGVSFKTLSQAAGESKGIHSDSAVHENRVYCISLYSGKLLMTTCFLPGIPQCNTSCPRLSQLDKRVSDAGADWKTWNIRTFVESCLPSFWGFIHTKGVFHLFTFYSNVREMKERERKGENVSWLQRNAGKGEKKFVCLFVSVELGDSFHSYCCLSAILHLTEDSCNV